MIEALFLLLPVAAASGWWLARRDQRAGRSGSGPAHPDFLRGLNYLLEEQPDKAIDMFLNLADVDGETLETHLALGNLFRRRGELDRAIRIHQNLVSRNNLTTERRGYALFELGQDYLRAGLLDRAEDLFQELVQLGLHRQPALQALLEIYQQERDWLKCLEVAGRLKTLSGQAMAPEVAQYHCELAEEARSKGDPDGAQRHLRLAQLADPGCVRAVMLEGFAALEEAQGEQAVTLFLRVAERGSAYVPEILPALIDAMRQCGRGEELLGLLEGLARHHASPPLMLSLAEVVAQVRGPEAALDVLTHYLSRYAALSVLERLLLLQSQGVEANGKCRYRASVVLEVVRHLLGRQPDYQCEQCGFQARSLHWQCPSCRSWGKIVPVQPDPIVGDEVLHERRLA
jgi:lipopolysaccharide assembly protein B